MGSKNLITTIDLGGNLGVLALGSGLLDVIRKPVLDCKVAIFTSRISVLIDNI